MTASPTAAPRSPALLLVLVVAVALLVALGVRRAVEAPPLDAPRAPLGSAAS